MLDALISGAVAGYAIAIPVGAIAILIIETGLRGGFRAGFAAGSGAATADLIYATVAATIGSALAVLLTPFAPGLKWASALFLIGMGTWGLARMRQSRCSVAEATVESGRGNLVQTYAMLLALTLLNPATVAYFAALILGLNVGARLTLEDKILFVLGAFLASWSWQTLLAAVGALAHKHLSPGFRNVTSLIGNFMIIGLGIRILV
jgi:arginine exporter protein ArgO